MKERLERLRDAWNGLSGREQRLLGLMGGVAAFLVVGAAVLFTSSAVAEVRDERDELRDVLAAIQQAAPAIEAAERRRQASRARYQNQVPPLGSYVEQKAKQEGVELRQVNEQPTKQLGKYRRRHIRVRINGVELRPMMRLLSSLFDGNVPVALEELDIQHYSSGDKYNAELGIYAFDLETKASAKKDED